METTVIDTTWEESCRLSFLKKQGILLVCVMRHVGYLPGHGWKASLQILGMARGGLSLRTKKKKKKKMHFQQTCSGLGSWLVHLWVQS